MAAAAFACLLLFSVEPSAGWVLSVVAWEPGCVYWESMTRETSFPDIFRGYESMIFWYRKLSMISKLFYSAGMEG